MRLSALYAPLVLAGTFLGAGEIPATAQEGDKPVLVQDEKKERERINQEIQRAREIINCFKKKSRYN